MSAGLLFRRLFRPSLDISPLAHIRHQVAFQKHTDNAVSKTINLPEHAGLSDVSEAYRTAWKEGAKGITVYRYGFRREQVLNRNVPAGDLPLVQGGIGRSCLINLTPAVEYYHFNPS